MLLEALILRGCAVFNGQGVLTNDGYVPLFMVCKWGLLKARICCHRP